MESDQSETRGSGSWKLEASEKAAAAAAGAATSDDANNLTASSV